MEEAASIVECPREVNGAVEKQLSGDKGIGIDTGFRDVSVDLLEGSEGSAVVQ